MIAYNTEDTEQGDHSPVAGGNANLNSHYGNQDSDSLGNWE